MAKQSTFPTGQKRNKYKMKKQDLINVGLLIKSDSIFDKSENEIYIQFLGVVDISKITMLDLFKRLATEREEMGRQSGRTELTDELKRLLNIS